MRIGRNFLYAVLAVAGSLTYALLLGSYWLTDALVFALVAALVASLCFAEKSADSLFDLLGFSLARTSRYRGTKTAHAELDQRERIPRSRIAHYVMVSRIKSTAALASISDSPFERAVLCNPAWQTLPAERLDEVARKLP